MRFIFGFIGIAVGFLLVWKADWILNNFGHIEWAEEHLSTEGGTRLFWKLLGLLIIILSMLYMFGILQGIILSIFSSMFRGMA
ncbi:MAG: hypothetical protein COT81_02660 [Candidatus Buchananbacteria bacterium CG10_big_fil_rev_8_21_14_0_10_42_9]|uniref:Uncharacterized protein n=1 Tax=Candidatus Buchananbacteria bacterium CG10_big_fil_rev_8_21_14_0_10_42_9 TaxID=1974526 RepID=A0A2H0W1D2_9BACT|nr:MAG: hypothetical protein COT81_02660 [Candidatus Buchananbacteria bacterium CG10_big_fil_rev_8_21_14_0_10_42_9]